MKILLAIDDSKFSEAATQAVTTYFRSQDSEVRVIHIIDLVPLSGEAQTWGFAPNIGEVLDQQRKGAEAIVAQAAQNLLRAGFQVTTGVCEGDPRTEILNAATQLPADLIVLGSHGRRGLDRFLLGSVSEAVARHASCSVLIVRVPTKSA